MVWGSVPWILLAAETMWCVWGQPAPKSPCPNVFWYEVDSSGNWRGRMSIPAPPPGVTFRTVVELDIDAVLPTQNVGAVKLLEHENEVWRRISTGSRWPVQYQVYFPLAWPLPQLRSIVSNGNVICINSMSHTFLTRVTLEHVLYPVGGGPYQPQIYMTTSTPAPYKEGPANDGLLSAATNFTAFPPLSACPGIFQYLQISSGEWFGRINVPNPYPVLAIDIKVEIYVIGNVPMISSGTLQPANNLNQEWNRIKAGEKFFVQYNLQFPVYKTYPSYRPPLPTIKSIIVNDNILCSGDQPSYSLLITIAYQHSIFSERCPSSSLTCQHNIAYTAQQNQPATPGHVQPPQTYDMTSQIFTPTMQIYQSPPTPETTPQSYRPSPATYAPASQTYEPSSTSNEPPPQVYETSPPTPAPTPVTYGPSTQRFEMASEIFTPSPTTYKPIFHNYTQSTTTYKPTYPRYSPSSPPTYKPAYPTYTQSTTTHKPTYPPYSPSSPAEERILNIDTDNKSQCGTLIIRNPLISNGENTSPGQWPWHAALYLYSKRDMEYRCGGSFVGIRTIITAAHCVHLKGELLRAQDVIIFLGRHNLRNMHEYGFQSKDVAKIAVHPTYNVTYNVGDIALLILSTVVEITTMVRPVCLWGQDDSRPADIIDQEGLVVGWGLDERDEPTEVLMMVKMPVVSQQKCIWSDPNYYSHFTSSGTFCAGFRNGSSVCNGDSGGGMVFPRNLKNGTPVWMLRGIVSSSRARTGYNICDTKSFIVFTDIVQYLDWIYEIYI